MAATAFTPIAPTLGGALIGVSAVILMLFKGRIAGISGILGRLLPPYADADAAQAAAFVAGLVASPFVYAAIAGVRLQQTVSQDLPLMAVAGLLVGFGAIYGGGCTSGHGVCGLSRLSKRSLVATLTFMTAGFITVFTVRHLIGGWPWAS